MLKARMLVVEDEVIIALDIQRTLIRMGYDVPEFVTSAESALERIGTLQPDLVLMDIHLSGAMDGIAAADEIRKQHALPVVFLTAHSDEATLNRAKITEPYGYVLKPFEERELQIAIDIALYRHSAETKLRQMERWLGTTLESLGDGVIATRLDGSITFMNRMAEVLTGWPQPEALGRPFGEVLRLVYQTTGIPITNLVERVLENGLIIDLSPDTALINREGMEIPVDKSAAPIRDKSGNVAGIVIVFRELTARKYVEEKLRHFAVHDVLTGLPNEILLTDRLSQAFEHAKRYPDYAFALLVIDLDRFRHIIDSYGDVFGDMVLSAVAQRLRENLRGADTLARVGGDEFMVLLTHINDLLDVVRIAQRILDKIAEAVIIEGQEAFISASIGIVLSEPRYQRTEDILHDAVFALRQAKTQGDRRLRVFNTVQNNYAIRLLQLEADLNLAIERNEFRIHYQPIVELASGTLSGFEALLHWQYSEHGLLAPADFWALAEKIGILVKISAWMLHESCRQLRAWQQLSPANAALSVAVNLSQTQFLHPSLRNQLTQALAASGLDARYLCLEIPEEVAAADPLVSSHILAELDELGVQLHLDDFDAGGKASLNLLQHPSIHTIKIDRSAVRSVSGTSDRKSAIVRSILSLAGELGKKVAAEGIETAEQAERLLSWGCRCGQGYHFAEPLATKDVERLLASEAKT
ncbi:MULTISPECIES: putative bifunctional diguanylate cyclase/phosphodiesterase [Methylomicrobium]|uniref:PAS domain S-box/diguanylate cyclase (GGDEF) domain-containing protein n=1 Tax=Methylomicrobium album BG8 TaxID=686340 RepID=H8GML1_METAL|nr:MULTISPECIES: EAL domain-containing protein [Methylomicrobium]EIC28251.1 PAS domain S-box/diguanylate cyclase (GGDEF) domain-containing protein [Methylomicrobium album BG8]